LTVRYTVEGNAYRKVVSLSFDLDPRATIAHCREIINLVGCVALVVLEEEKRRTIWYLWLTTDLSKRAIARELSVPYQRVRRTLNTRLVRRSHDLR
jgi:hypothetical protein